jgi:hypothetical protein
MAREAGAAMTDALSNWEALMPNPVYAAKSDPAVHHNILY